MMRDPLAWTLFCYILLSVNRETGKLIAGRFYLAKELGVKPNTVYKALLRLAKKYKVVTLSSNNRFTEIRVLNWAKYQLEKNPVTPPVTTQSQHSNTIQELRNNNILHKTSSYGEESPEFNKNSRVVEEFQEEALRVADQLGIDLDKATRKIPSLRARWFKLFRDAYLKNQKARILSAYSYCSDHPHFREITSDQKMLLFFWRFSNETKTS